MRVGALPIGLVSFVALCSSAPAPRVPPGLVGITGRVLEGCSCMVPCPCNFGQHPSPHAFCDSLAFFELQRGEFDGVPLGGLRFVIAERNGGAGVLFLDAGQSASQRAALRRIATWILTLEETPLVAVLSGPIKIEFGQTHLTGSVEGTKFGLSVRPLVGNDGRSAVTVANPWIFGSFPIKSSRKGVAERLRVLAPGLSFTYSNTNANDAYFQFRPDQVR